MSVVAGCPTKPVYTSGTYVVLGSVSANHAVESIFQHDAEGRILLSPLALKLNPERLQHVATPFPSDQLQRLERRNANKRWRLNARTYSCLSAVKTGIRPCNAQHGSYEYSDKPITF